MPATAPRRFARSGARAAIFVSFGKYTAFPHGSSTPQKLKEGDVVLMDGGCSVEGYQSDITRTFVFGKPTQRQRDIWNLETRSRRTPALLPRKSARRVKQSTRRRAK